MKFKKIVKLISTSKTFFCVLSAPILMKFDMEVVLDVKYLQLKFCPNWLTLRGVMTAFFIDFTKKNHVFFLRYLKIITY